MKIDIDRAIEVLSACGYECDEIESLRQQLASCQSALADTEALEIGTGERLAKVEQQLAAALAACKLKDEILQLSINEISTSYLVAMKEALAIQPDDYALKAWLGEPRSYLYKFNSEFGDGTFWSHRPTHNGEDALEAIPLYAPKGLK